MREGIIGNGVIRGNESMSRAGWRRLALAVRLLAAWRQELRPERDMTAPNQPLSHACGACCTRLSDFAVTAGASVILQDINLHLHCGQLVALIGPNGAGKTTLLRAMLGEIPHAGTLQFLPAGRAIRRPQRIGYVPQRLEVDAAAPITVQDLFIGALSRRPLWLGYSRRWREEAAAALATVHAGNLLRHKIGRLSGGELQRVLLALALTPRPDILLLDEPVAAVDQSGTVLFYDLLSRLRKDLDLAILLVSHDLAAVARVADRVLFLNRRILADGTPADVLRSEAVRKEFGFDFTAAALPPPAMASQHHYESNEGNYP